MKVGHFTVVPALSFVLIEFTHGIGFIASEVRRLTLASVFSYSAKQAKIERLTV